MKKYYLIKHQHLFCGEKQLKASDTYFEGWYFKTISPKLSIAFIPGINISKKEKKAFIQIITNENSYNIEYSIDDFHFHHDPFYIRISNNYFSKEKIVVDIHDKELTLTGEFYFTQGMNIKSSLLSPNIMGIFSYFPFMECHHAIIQMKANSHGYIQINHNEYFFDDGISYIEKDWGISFPKSYIWMQANHFQNDNASFMLSIADIPFHLFHFNGLICSLMIDNKEYRFATYNLSKIIDYDIINNYLILTLKKRSLTLIIKAYLSSGCELLAPIKGQMNKNIIETISSTITVILKEKDKTIFCDTSKQCGLEIVT